MHGVDDVLPAFRQRKTVDSNYFTSQMGCTATLIRRMARTGTILSDCIICSTENGDSWEFDRHLIDGWIE